MRLIPRFLGVTLTLFCCVGCDQVSKSAARALLATGVTESYLGDALRLQLVENPGSFLSLGASLPEQLRFALFTGAVAVLLLDLVGASLFATRLGSVAIHRVGAGRGRRNQQLDRPADE